VKKLQNLYGEVGMLVAPENISAWERALPRMSQADRALLQGLVDEMKQGSPLLRDQMARPLARTA
jgi:hypothetical protein